MGENTPEKWYKELPSLTRIGVTTIFATTVLVQLQILNPALIILNWPLVTGKFQVWRLLSSVLFFGPFSFNFVFQLYFFVSFSSKLERNEIFSPPGEYLFFLIFQILLLDVLSLILAWPAGFPMLGPSLVFAIIYYWSRREPYGALSFFSFSIKGYQFPFVLIFFQMLMGGSVWMDLLGLAAGHIYYFLKEVVPSEYGHTLLRCPYVFTALMLKIEKRGGNPDAARAANANAPPPPRFGGQGHRLGGN